MLVFTMLVVVTTTACWAVQFIIGAAAPPSVSSEGIGIGELESVGSPHTWGGVGGRGGPGFTGYPNDIGLNVIYGARPCLGHQPVWRLPPSSTEGALLKISSGTLMVPHVRLSTLSMSWGPT